MSDNLMEHLKCYPLGWGRHLLVLLFSLVAIDDLYAQAPQGPSLVVAGGVFEGEFSEQRSFVGSVEAIRQSIVGSAVEGRVRAVNVERGDPVRGRRDGVKNDAGNDDAGNDSESSAFLGDVLVEVETETLQIEIDTAQIQFNLTQQAYDELKISLPAEIEFAAAKVAETSARAEYAKNDFERMRKISTQSNAISTTEMELSRSQFLVDQQLANQAALELKRLKATAEIRLQQAAVRADAARQEIIRLEDQKKRHSIRAPFDGFVINKSTEVGAWIARGDPVAEIVELDEVDFAFNVSQDLVVTIQQALADSGKTPPVVIKIEGVETELLGQLLSIVPQVDLRSRLATVRARVVNPTAGGIPILKPGMLGRALIAIGSKRSMRVISRDALVLGGQKPVVYKVISRDNKNIVVPIQVTLGSNLGDWVEVIGDLQDGDRVIVEGNERLRANAEVEISKSRPDKPSF